MIRWQTETRFWSSVVVSFILETGKEIGDKGSFLIHRKEPIIKLGHDSHVNVKKQRHVRWAGIQWGIHPLLPSLDNHLSPHPMWAPTDISSYTLITTPLPSPLPAHLSYLSNGRMPRKTMPPLKMTKITIEHALLKAALVHPHISQRVITAIAFGNCTLPSYFTCFPISTPSFWFFL